jgi:5-methylcytosine-specific restriction protein A
MPRAAPRPCSHPGCGRLVRDGSGRCELHPRPVWAKRPDGPRRIAGRKRQRLRAQLFAEQPLCVECERQGRVRLATQRDHIVPLSEGGTEDRENTQGLCEDCHAAKSEAERRRGLSRTRAAGE